MKEKDVTESFSASSSYHHRQEQGQQEQEREQEQERQEQRQQEAAFWPSNIEKLRITKLHRVEKRIINKKKQKKNNRK